MAYSPQTWTNGAAGDTPLSAARLAHIEAGISAAHDGTVNQPLDSDLTDIAGLSPSNDDVIQCKTGAWTNRTMVQLASDLRPAAQSNVVLATDMGYKAWAYDPMAASGTQITADGVIFVVRLQCRTAETWTNLHLCITTLGSSLDAGQNFVGLYNSAGTRVGVSADQSATFAGTTGEKTIAFTAPVSVTAGFYWGAILCNGTTPVTLARGSNAAAAFGAQVSGAAAYRFGNAGSGTALPASFTPSALSDIQNGTFWVGIS